jgi:PAS domain S-box-containing protein
LAGSTASQNSYSGKTLLLVEDEVLIAMNEAEILESYGFRVISAASAEDAIEAVQKNEIDLILMDIDLGHGNMDGTEAAETILEGRDIPVVFLSSHTEPEIVEKTENITSYGYVVKNSGETVLMASIKMAFRLHDAYKKRIEKSNQLDTLLDNAEDFIGRLDRNRAHLYVNSALCNAVGIPFEEYVGKTIEELGYPPELSQKWNEAVDSVFESGKPARIEFPFPGADADRVLDCRIVPELVHNGDVHTVVAISRDITERKKVYEQIRDSEKKLKYFVKHTNDWVWQVDVDGRYTYSSPSAVNIIGYTPKEVIGKTPFDFMEKDEAARIGPLFSKIVRNMKDIVGLEDVMIHKDGRKIVFETNAIPVFYENSTLKGYFGTCRNITKRKQIEEELRRQEGILNEAQQIARIGSFVWDLRDDSLEWSENMYSIAGLDPEDFYGNLQDTSQPLSAKADSLKHVD